MIYLLHKVDGSTKKITARRPLGLRRLQELVGGFVEYVRIKDGSGRGQVLCVNEEGKLINMPKNPKFPKLNGDVLEGRLKNQEFVGVE